MKTKRDPNELIERPDGSFIPYGKLPPEDQLSHDVVHELCGKAKVLNAALTEFKKTSMSELLASRKMMLEDYGVKKGGKSGNLTLRSVCGRLMVRMSVAKHVTFGPELDAAKALLDEFMEAELAKGGSEFIAEIVEDVFKVNSKGRIDTGGILGLRKHQFDNPLWERAMQAIENAICRDSETTYINFFDVDPHVPDKADADERIKLEFAKV